MAQIIRPSTTVTNGGAGFHNISGGGTFHGAVSDQSDSTQINATGSDDYGRLATTGTDPGVDTGHVLNARGFRTSGTGLAVIDIYQGNPGSGGTSILIVGGTWSAFSITGGPFANTAYTLDTTEAALITDYANLYWHFSKSAGTSTYAWVELWFEFPDAPAVFGGWGIPIFLPVPPFDPLSISGCKAWYDFSDITTLWQDYDETTQITADAQTIASVSDKSGGARYLNVDGGATNEPAYRTGQIAGLSVGRFDGVDNSMSAVDWTADTSFTVFIVARKNSALTTNTDTLLAMDAEATLYTDTSDSGTQYVWRSNSAASNIPVGGTPTDVTCMVLRVNSASSLFVYPNGGNPTATFDPDDQLTLSSNFRLGSTLLSTNYGDYDIGEVLVYDTALSASSMNAVGTYLASKWGFTWTAAYTGGFEPTDITGCKAWWDFSDISSLFQNSARTTPITADAQTIGGVADKSGAGKHLSQATASAEPAYKTGIINGKSIARFDGIDNFLSNTAMAADASWTLFIVAKKATAPTFTTDTLFGTNSTNAYFATHATLSTSYFWQFNQAGGYPVLSVTPTNTNVMVLRIASASSMGLYQNGGSPGLFDPNDDITTITTYHLGNNGGTDYGDYDIGEVIAYDTALSNADLNTIGQYLATKWGTTWTTVT